MTDPATQDKTCTCKTDAEIGLCQTPCSRDARQAPVSSNLRLSGVSRADDDGEPFCQQVIELHFNRTPTEDELRALHVYMRYFSGDSSAPQAPIFRVVLSGGQIVGATPLAPGLPDGEHELYCEPEAIAPYLRSTVETKTMPRGWKSVKAFKLARQFHECYERLAPSFGYETRKETRAFDPHSPNGQLMIAVCRELIEKSAEETKVHPVIVRKGCTCDPTQYGGQCMCPPSQITVECVQPENGIGD